MISQFGGLAACINETQTGVMGTDTRPPPLRGAILPLVP
jgi:hypothetical protein